jgi:hypothetical protein
MNNNFLTRFAKDHKKLSDMHEPDEQGISVEVFGNHLDNAMGDGVEHSCGEYNIRIKNEYTNETEEFNLSNLIAAARRSK